MNITDVIFEILPGAGGDVGKIILNRPNSLNALNLTMCTAVHNQLDLWANMKSIKAVIITGAGERAFCAGGDVRAVYELCAQQRRYDEAMVFFQQEYAMNQAIFDFPKPYLAFLDGITMGGGVGISIHGSHAIGTERLIWAMPETRIGFFPDVGVGYHLARFPNHIGDFLALTGQRILAGDALELNLVKVIIPSNQLSDLENAIMNTYFTADDFDIVTHTISQFHQSPEEKLYTLNSHDIQTINTNFSKSSVEEICTNPEIATLLATQSPISLKITLKHLQHCEHLSFPKIMAENSCLAKNLIHGHDFMEGIRAQMIDKDKHPQWQPSSLPEVTDAMLQKCFSN
jgi:enoyl-CoA hydratase